MARERLRMNRTAGRVTPYAPPSHLSRLGAHGVTRPAAAAFTTSRRATPFQRVLCIKISWLFLLLVGSAFAGEVWTIAASGKPIVADVDGDGLVEVVAVGNDGVLRAIGEAAAK